MLTELLIAGAGYAGFKLLQKKVRGSWTSVGEDIGKMKGVVKCYWQDLQYYDTDRVYKGLYA